MTPDPVFAFDRAIVREPARSIVGGLRAVDRGASSYEAVVAEHAAYVAALERPRSRSIVDRLAGRSRPFAADSRLFVEDRCPRVPTTGAILLRARLGREGIVTTPAGVLHFKSDCSLLDERTVLSTRRLAASGVFEGLDVLHVPDGEEGAANALRVNDCVFVGDAFPRTAALLGDREYRVVRLPTVDSPRPMRGCRACR